MMIIQRSLRKRKDSIRQSQAELCQIKAQAMIPTNSFIYSNICLHTEGNNLLYMYIRINQGQSERHFDQVWTKQVRDPPIISQSSFFLSTLDISSI